MHLLDEDLISGLNIGVPFCSHCSRDRESCVRICLTGKEEEGRLLCAVINLVLLLFQRHVEVLAYENTENGLRKQ